MRDSLPWFPLSDDPRRCIRRSTTDCRGCRSSLLVGRSGRCGCRRGIVLRLCCCGRFGLRGRSRPDRCRYRCRCLGKCTPVPVSCRLRRRNGYVLDRCLSSPVCFVALLRGGYGGRCGRVGRDPSWKIPQPESTSANSSRALPSGEAIWIW